MAPRYTYVDGPDGSSCLSIALTALPCPGVALRLNTVIDCTPSEDRMPPVTIDFLKHLPEEEEEPAAAEQQQVATGRFTCSSGDFLLFSQLQRTEAMVAAAGLPRECAASVNEFLHLSAGSATNTFYKAVAITVEAGAPGSMAVDEYADDEDEELPPGAVVGECAICYREYLVGGATSVKLPCSHTFHRRCMDRWTVVNRTCPYCRAPVPEEQDNWDDEGDCDGSEPEYEDDSIQQITASLPSSTWSRTPVFEPPVPDGSIQQVTAPLAYSTWSRTAAFDILFMFVCVGLFAMTSSI